MYISIFGAYYFNFTNVISLSWNKSLPNLISVAHNIVKASLSYFLLIPLFNKFLSSEAIKLSDSIPLAVKLFYLSTPSGTILHAYNADIFLLNDYLASL